MEKERGRERGRGRAGEPGIERGKLGTERGRPKTKRGRPRDGEREIQEQRTRESQGWRGRVRGRERTGKKSERRQEVGPGVGKGDSGVRSSWPQSDMEAGWRWLEMGCSALGFTPKSMEGISWTIVLDGG